VTNPKTHARAVARPKWADEIHLDEVGLVARLLRIHLLFGRLLDEVTSREGLSDTDYLVLALIQRSPGAGSPTHIADVLGRSTGGMTLTVDRLASMGWVTRSPDPNDRRRVLLQLTPDGLAITVRVRAALHGWEDDLQLDDEAATDAFLKADALLDLLARPRTTADKDVRGHVPPTGFAIARD
jgi:DNA-binding MarR family transcriptional regulator